MTERKIIIGETMLLAELKKFSRTCCLETARHLDEQEGDTQYLESIADGFAVAYLRYLISLNEAGND